MLGSSAPAPGPPPEELTLELPGLRLAARAWGPADGLPVLGLHGWLDNAATFDLLVPMLPGIRLVSLDLPGHGLSDRLPLCATYGMVDYVVQTTAAADALGWDRFCLMGHSMGAAVSTLVAGTLPDRVQRLVLLEGLVPMVTPAAEAPRQLARGLAARRKLLGKQGPPYPSRAAGVARLLEANPTLARRSAEILVARGMGPVEDEAGTAYVWRHDLRLRGESLTRFTPEQVQAFVEAVRCPVLMVRARQGWDFPMDLFRALMAAFPDGRMVEVEGHHHVHLDAPERVAPLVSPFLSGGG